MYSLSFSVVAQPSSSTKAAAPQFGASAQTWSHPENNSASAATSGLAATALGACVYRGGLRRRAKASGRRRKAVECRAAADATLSLVGGVDELKRVWLEDIRPDFVPDIDEDPYLSPPDVEKMVGRFLQAEKNQKSKDPVATAAARLRRTAEFRRDYRVADFHRKGMARQLFMHKTNPGASMYFADAGLRDRDGEPVLMGRSSLMVDTDVPGRKDADKMIASTHLRAGIFVVERAAVEVKNKASYILDLGAYPKEDLAKRSNQRFWDADGYEDCSSCIKGRCAPTTSVGPHLPEHEVMPDGLPVLKEALRCVTEFYPELLKKVYFYRPGFLFRTIYAVFSMWVPKDTRQKFVLVNEGDEHKFFLAPDACDPADVPPELGGSGEPMCGDRFIAKAIDRYDATATKPESESVDMHSANRLPPVE